ncbi:MAG: Y-family DNA polymerase, partial [Steroidobacterales bacterium]
LAAWAYQWSSQVSYRAPAPDTGTANMFAGAAVLWLELGASSTLFGSHADLLSRVTAELADLRYSATLALAPTPEGAALLARAAGGGDPVRVFSLDELRARIAPLPLHWLALAPPVITALKSSGLCRIGEVLALSADAVARRFGPQTSLHLRQLCGTAPDPRVAWHLPAMYRTRHEFSCDIRDSIALLFPLQRLLREFQGYLRATDRAVQRFTLRFAHYRRSESVLELGLSQPSRDAAQLTQLVRERLAATVLPAPVAALTLEALEFTTPAVLQHDFFGTAAERAQQCQQVLDRLMARLGAQNVQHLRLTDEHRPERAWSFAAAQGSAAAEPATGPPDARPCWLLTEPRRIDTPARVLSGPERIESGWWDDGEMVRDYYRASAATGGQLWVFQDLRDGDWYLQGLWS